MHALNLAIQVCRAGNEIWQIGQAIEDYARSKGCSVVNQFVGYGAGIAFHKPPKSRTTTTTPKSHLLPARSLHHRTDDPRRRARRGLSTPKTVGPRAPRISNQAPNGNTPFSSQNKAAKSLP
ncbi:MAG: M24 family metallopeptidase [Verrucomicrobia bacterium]|nr:M24 family metallopeptidase [Verrucomicrobiota bacterium]